ncbi:alpha-tocopherol transfer protein [Neodiprion lecontei]|uniref:Alpha-tocopherol transfer protein n=1 Tax=Neodiprion lecontei TaxID=441921 RepID=A0A6J0BH55_NEOLC|nr:alpha-tocopherol transfer protein [Neodiprion lecontei]
MSLLNFEKCSVEELCSFVGGSKQLLDELREKLREWLKLQPHLPQGAEDERLEWFLLGSKLSLELAKQKLDTYYTIRGLIPEFFADRDPISRPLTRVHDIMQIVILPKLTPEKYRTYILRVISGDTSIASIQDLYKYVFMGSEMRMIEDRSNGDNLIYDFSMMSLGQLMTVTPTFLKKCEVTASAHALKLKGIHILNTSPFVGRMVTMAKSVLKPKLASRIHVHPGGNFESLHQFVPKSILPEEYGGTSGTMAELSAALRKIVNGNRDWFLEQEKVLVNERLRPGPAVNGDSLFGFSGSFRKLDVD